MNLIKSILLSLVHIKFLNRWIVFVIDLLFALLSIYVSLNLVEYTVGSITADIPIGILSLFAILAGMLSVFLLKTYKGIIRHSAFTEIFRIALASALKSIFMVAFVKLSGYTVSPLPMLACFDAVFTFFLLVFFRAWLIVAYYWLMRHFSDQKENILIYYDPTVPIELMPVQFTNDNHYQVVGYICHGSEEHIRIEGHKVYFFRDLEDVRDVVALNVSSILFPSAAAARHEENRLLAYCEQIGVSTLLLPSISDWESYKQQNNGKLPTIRIEDLLERDEIQINMDEIHRSLKGKTVLVTGAAGSIGSELCRQLCTFDLKQLVLLDNAETPMHYIRLELEETYPEVRIHPEIGDVRLADRLDRLFAKYRPDVVFHAAAYKHVPLMEENPCEAVHTNGEGTRIVADTAVRHGVDKFIMISTDKAVNPTNVMGASKRLAEIYVQSLSEAIERGEIKGRTKFVTTRFGNVLGSNGSVIPRFRHQIEKGGPVTVTHPDIIRYFMTIPEACRLVLEASFLGNGSDIFVFDMGEPVKIDTLARRMIQLSGLVPGKDISIIYTGLRPGEKLYEELLATKENTLPTSNRQIFRAKVRQYEYKKVNTALNHLYVHALEGEGMKVVRALKQLIPEFKSNNSVYEQLDQPSEKKTVKQYKELVL